MRFTIFQDTDQGGRSINQDRMGYCYSRESLLMVVADGMGGHIRGEVAAQLTVQACAGLFQKMATPRLADPSDFLEAALMASHRELLQYQARKNLPEAPRTTVIACVVQDGFAWWAHAGDSRLYWLRGSRIMSRTLDHSKVQAMASLGLISPDELETHPERNKVLNCLGSPQDPSLETTSRVRLAHGDLLVLCSDGFWSGIPDRGFASAFQAGPVADIVPGLVERAVAHNGRTADNATVVALSWDGSDADGEFPTLSSINLPEGAVTTTIAIGQFDDDEASSSEMSEEDIERQISEIRQAILRSNEDPQGGPA
jgi:protein phosphatase